MIQESDVFAERVELVGNSHVYGAVGRLWKRCWKPCGKIPFLSIGFQWLIHKLSIAEWELSINPCLKQEQPA